MATEIGHFEAIFRYPVKSMCGERLETAQLGWHGLEGDRRLAFRRLDDRSGFPWLSASNLPELLLFVPFRRGDESQADLPTHVRTPDGEELEAFGEPLAAEIGRRHGAPVRMMHWRQGLFDEASISVIAGNTVHEIGRLAGNPSTSGGFARTSSCVCCGRVPSRRTHGWAASSRSGRATTRRPSP